jgi:tol-pal system protein YbgF
VPVVAVAVPVPVTPERAPRPSAASERPEVVYAAALNTFRAHEHGQAVLDFMDFVARHPTHTRAPNAQYWIGEAYYAERDYRHAVVEFQRVVAMAPKTAKAADAWLRIGMCHANLREPALAAAAWQRVLREHPRSEAAPKARAFLQRR